MNKNIVNILHQENFLVYIEFDTMTWICINLPFRQEVCLLREAFCCCFCILQLSKNELNKVFHNNTNVNYCSLLLDGRFSENRNLFCEIILSMFSSIMNLLVITWCFSSVYYLLLYFLHLKILLLVSNFKSNITWNKYLYPNNYFVIMTKYVMSFSSFF